MTVLALAGWAVDMPHVLALPAAVLLFWWAFARVDLYLSTALFLVPLSLNLSEFGLVSMGWYMPTEPMLFALLLVFVARVCSGQTPDEAFLRRIPYKIEVNNPTVEQFSELVHDRASKFGVALEPGIIDYLIERHFKQQNRELRFCHVEDLLNQARDYCSFHDQSLMLTREIADIAILNYFSQS